MTIVMLALTCVLTLLKPDLATECPSIPRGFVAIDGPGNLVFQLLHHVMVLLVHDSWNTRRVRMPKIKDALSR
ncbi:hypothetical protein B0H15DRAFT_477230 [Mycena belliarum]|uniref:Secreted protein n=1 Tax=Mycena belliarum TaxID=1033014 RepID=A0AAD6XM42_9AGAR|nr:hypothetical protein B0H15DRAFT_477230 [Mycena belliae]